MTDPKQTPPPAIPEDAPPGYETTDAKARPILIGIVAATIFIALIAVVLNEVFVYTRESLTQEVVLSRVNPKLREIEAEGTAKISSYAWVDSANGIVRIPVDRAIEVLAEEAYRKRSR